MFQELELELNDFKSTSESLGEKLAQLEIRTSNLEKVKSGLESELQTLQDESEKKLRDLVINLIDNLTTLRILNRIVQLTNN